MGKLTSQNHLTDPFCEMAEEADVGGGCKRVAEQPRHQPCRCEEAIQLKKNRIRCFKHFVHAWDVISTPTLGVGSLPRRAHNIHARSCSLSLVLTFPHRDDPRPVGNGFQAAPERGIRCVAHVRQSRPCLSGQSP